MGARACLRSSRRCNTSVRHLACQTQRCTWKDGSDRRHLAKSHLARRHLANVAVVETICAPRCDPFRCDPLALLASAGLLIAGRAVFRELAWSAKKWSASAELIGAGARRGAGSDFGSHHGRRSQRCSVGSSNVLASFLGQGEDSGRLLSRARGEPGKGNRYAKVLGSYGRWLIPCACARWRTDAQ